MDVDRPCSALVVVSPDALGAAGSREITAPRFRDQVRGAGRTPSDGARRSPPRRAPRGPACSRPRRRGRCSCSSEPLSERLRAVGPSSARRARPARTASRCSRRHRRRASTSRSDSSSRAVSITTGTLERTRIRRQTSRPSMSGSVQGRAPASRTGPRSMCSSAASPVPTDLTVKPSQVREVCPSTSEARFSSSSTSRTLPGAQLSGLN